MTRTIDALGNTEELENGAFTLKDLTLYLGKGSISLQNSWKIRQIQHPLLLIDSVAIRIEGVLAGE